MATKAASAVASEDGGTSKKDGWEAPKSARTIVAELQDALDSVELEIQRGYSPRRLSRGEDQTESTDAIMSDTEESEEDDEDPESGENELALLMDSLVEELQAELQEESPSAAFAATFFPNDEHFRKGEDTKSSPSFVSTFASEELEDQKENTLLVDPESLQPEKVMPASKKFTPFASPPPRPMASAHQTLSTPMITPSKLSLTLEKEELLHRLSKYLTHHHPAAISATTSSSGPVTPTDQAQAADALKSPQQNQPNEKGESNTTDSVAVEATAKEDTDSAPGAQNNTAPKAPTIPDNNNSILEKQSQSQSSVAKRRNLPNNKSKSRTTNTKKKSRKKRTNKHKERFSYYNDQQHDEGQPDEDSTGTTTATSMYEDDEQEQDDHDLVQRIANSDTWKRICQLVFQ